MDWKLVAVSFGTIFLAELGDKTQLATLALAGGDGSRWSVFLGSALALIATSAIAVLVGAGLTRVISPQTLQRGAGVLFVVLGIVYLVRAGR